MIKLNTQGDNTSPQLRTVLETGEQVSFLDRMSALAQKAISRLTGTGFAGGSFSRITKMIPAVMLAVFAFSAAQAQVYTRNFNNLNATGIFDVTTNASDATPGAYPGTGDFSTSLQNVSWTSGGSTQYRHNRGGSNYALAQGGNDDYKLTFNVPSGYELTITNLQFWKDASNGGATFVVDVNGSAFTNAGTSNITSTPNTPSAVADLTGAVTITINVGSNSGAFNTSRIDDVVLNGTLTQLCSAPITQGLTNNGPLCSSSSTLATIGLAGSENGVTYELLNPSNSVVATLVSTTTGAQNFSGTYPAGTYTVRAFNTATTSCSTAVVGTTTVASITTPTVSFVSNNDPICIGGKAVYQITGTKGATVNYTVTVNGGTPSAQQSVTLDPVNGSGTIEYTHATGTAGTIVVKLVSVTLNSCSNVLNTQPASTVNVRPNLVISAVTASQTICSGGTFTDIGYTLTGTDARTVYYRVAIAGGTTTSYQASVPSGLNAVGTTNAAALDVSTVPTTNAGTTPITHTIHIDSAVYVSGTGNCVAVLGNTVSLTVNPNPTFNFYLNTNIANHTLVTTATGSNNICVPVTQVTLGINNVVNGSFYTIVKDGVTLGSGSVTSGTAQLIPGVNFDPAGRYLVTVTSANNCPNTDTFDVVAVPMSSYVYTINGQTVTEGSVINVCEGKPINFSLTGPNGAAYTVTGLGAQSGSTLGTAVTWSIMAPSAGTTGGSMTLGSAPALPGCDVSVNYSIKVNANPVVGVKFNGTTISNGSNQFICENKTATIAISGVAGQFVEIWRYESNNSTYPDFNAVGQVGTFVIPPTGVYNYTYNVGPWAADHESSTNKRDFIRVELKNPTTLCSDTFMFKLKITQNPRVALSYVEGPSPITATVGTSLKNGDTVRVCYPSNIRFYFDTTGNNKFADYGNIDYRFVNEATSQQYTGTLTTAQPRGYAEFPVVAGAEGWYRLVATFTGGLSCDSSIRVYLKPNSKPVYTFVQTGTGTTPGNITFCEGYPKGITLTGSASLTQKYTITRTAGPGTAVEFSGNLTASAVSHIFAGLEPGTHNYTLTVTANTGVNECVATNNFSVIVTAMPKPVLQANGLLREDGKTYEYCEGEEVEYTISGLPTGSQYTLSRTNNLGTFVIGTGGTVASQVSVVTVVSDATNAGVYTLKVTNTSSFDVCDSIISFTVVNNDRPSLTKINVSGMLNCYGDSSGWVKYSYSGVADSFFTYIKDRNTGDTVQVHRSNLQTQPGITHSNLPAGDYRLTLTTNKGCDTSFNFSITQPATKVDVTVISTKDACNDAKRGEVVFNVSGGTVPDYHVTVVNLATQAIASDFTQPAAFSNYVVDKLPAGKYIVQVWDDNNCYDVDTFDIVGCSSPDLVPFAENLSMTTSLANGPDVPFSLDLYNIGQSPTTGNIVVNVTLPTGFSLTGTTGWTVTQSGSTFTLRSNTTIAQGAHTTITGTVSKTGTPSEGFFAVVVNVVNGSGGEVNATNNALVYLFNVNK